MRRQGAGGTEGQEGWGRCIHIADSLVAQLVFACNAGDLGLIAGSGRSPGEGNGLPTPVFLGFPGGSAGRESTCNAGDLGLIPGLGRFPGEGKGYAHQYSGLENSMDCIIHGVTKSLMQLRDFHFS